MLVRALLLLLGFLSHIQAQNISDSLVGKTLRVVTLPGSQPHEPDGWLTSYLELLSAEGGFEFVIIPGVSSDTGSSFQNCVYDVSRNETDLCLGNVWELPTRRALTAFTSTIGEDSFELLNAKAGTENPGLAQVFNPFEVTLWVTLFACILFESAALWVVEREDRTRAAVADSVYLGVTGFLGGGIAHSPKTTAGRFIGMGFAFLCLVAVASYTANLAAYLTVSNALTPISSLSDVESSGKQLCHQRVIQSAVEAFAQLSTTYTTSEVQTYANVSAGKCVGIVARLPFLRVREDHLCEVELVGASILRVPIGFPVNSAYANGLSALISKHRATGTLTRLQVPYEPTNKCGTTAAVSAKLSVKHLSGTFLGCAVLTALGCVFHVTHWYRYERGRDTDTELQALDGGGKTVTKEQLLTRLNTVETSMERRISGVEHRLDHIIALLDRDRDRKPEPPPLSVVDPPTAYMLPGPSPTPSKSTKLHPLDHKRPLVNSDKWSWTHA